MTNFTWQLCKDIEELDTKALSQLIDPDTTHSSPFLSHKFLALLESSNCVGPVQTGWQQNHILFYRQHQLVAFFPCYLKTDSYGEYIFDHSWANAYHHHGLEYYPKLVIGIPFTPVTGNRFLIHPNITSSQALNFLSASINDICSHLKASSCHALFLPQSDAQALIQSSVHSSDADDKKALWLQRLSVQFVWQNNDYSCYEDFTATLTSRRRRSIRKERQAVTNQHVSIKRCTGEALTDDVKTAFYLCYRQTYMKRSGHEGYLNQAFFEHLFTVMRDNIMVVTATHNGEIAASALFFYNKTQLFGRYWGGLRDIPGLHFECCYYQGIEFAIEKSIQQFNPGTQGEHKILRGFSPTLCYSVHYMVNIEFRRAIEDFLKHESLAMMDYKNRASSVLPYKELQL